VVEQTDKINAKALSLRANMVSIVAESVILKLRKKSTAKGFH